MADSSGPPDRQAWSAGKHWAGGQPSGDARFTRGSGQAAREAADMMKGLDALHTPDMVAGGFNSPTPAGMGNASANRSIGGQWPQNARVAGLDAAAREAAGELGENALMNVRLTRCPK